MLDLSKAKATVIEKKIQITKTSPDVPYIMMTSELEGLSYESNSRRLSFLKER